MTLKDVIGSPLKQTASGKARALSCTVSTSSLNLLVILAGTDPDNKEGGERGLKVGRLIPNQKMKMGWYKVPRSSFDYAPLYC